MLKNLTKNRNFLLKIFRITIFKKETIKLLNFFNKKKLNKIKTPKNLIFFVTNKCDAKCKHCFYWRSLNKKNNELNLIQIKKIVSSLKDQIDTLLITGGEPILRIDLYEIIDLFYRGNKIKKVHITSNGSNPEKISNLAKKILSSMDLELSIQISVDGNEEFHDNLRGVKIYQKAIKSLESLKKLKKYPNFILTSATTLSKYNESQLEKISQTMKNIGVDWGFNLIRGTNYGIINLDKELISNYSPSDSSLVLPSKNKIYVLINRFLPNKGDLRSILQREVFNISLKILDKKKPYLKCLSGKVDAVLYSNGDVSLCEITKPFGNLKDYDFNFYKLWNSRNARKFREKIKNCSCIHPCHIINSLKYDYSFFYRK